MIASAVLSFVLTGDGRVSGVVVKDQGSLADSPLGADCVRATVIRWEFPRPRAGGRLWFEVTGSAPEEVREASRSSSANLPLFRAPRERAPGCIAKSIRAPPHAAGARIVAKFFVDAEGRASNFVLAAKAEDGRAIALAHAARDAVYACPFLPGADESGQPVGLWIIQPVVVGR